METENLINICFEKAAEEVKNSSEFDPTPNEEYEDYKSRIIESANALAFKHYCKFKGNVSFGDFISDVLKYKLI